MDDPFARRAARFRVMCIGRRHPCTVAELQAIAAASSAPVTRLPPGVHEGWEPALITDGNDPLVYTSARRVPARHGTH